MGAPRVPRGQHAIRVWEGEEGETWQEIKDEGKALFLAKKWAEAGAKYNEATAKHEGRAEVAAMLANMASVGSRDEGLEAGPALCHLSLPSFPLPLRRWLAASGSAVPWPWRDWGTPTQPSAWKGGPPRGQRGGGGSQEAAVSRRPVRPISSSATDHQTVEEGLLGAMQVGSRRGGVS